MFLLQEYVRILENSSLPTTILQWRWLNQPNWKMWSSNWIISPRVQAENKKYLSCHHLANAAYLFSVSEQPCKNHWSHHCGSWHHRTTNYGRSSRGNSENDRNPREPQHTPGTYPQMMPVPQPPKWFRNSFIINCRSLRVVLVCDPGVCWKTLRRKGLSCWNWRRSKSPGESRCDFPSIYS